MLAFSNNTGLYKFLLVCHILSAIVGLGAIMLNGLYAAQAAKRPGPAGRAVTEANHAVTVVAEKVIYLIPVFGILLVLASDEAVKFSDTFVWVSLLLYFVAIGIAHGVLLPGTKRIIALQLEMEQGPAPAGGPPPQVAEIQTIGKRLAPADMINDLLVVVILALMVWHPI